MGEPRLTLGIDMVKDKFAVDSEGFRTQKGRTPEASIRHIRGSIVSCLALRLGFSPIGVIENNLGSAPSPTGTEQPAIRTIPHRDQRAPLMRGP